MTCVTEQLTGYESQFEVSDQALELLRSGRMLGADEEPKDMVNRVIGALSLQEAEFSGTRRADAFAEELGELMDNGKVVMSTPIMTNAGKHLDRPLSACTVPTTASTGNRELLGQEIMLLHQQGMGTGFNLDDSKDPVELLEYLNSKAVEGANSGNEDRPVGNMAILDIRHPSIVDFINAKIDAPSGEKVWKFNISVNADESFFVALESGDNITLWDGTQLDANSLFRQLSEAAHKCADPGLIFLDKMNYRNPTPLLGEYRTTAPCAEVGLIEGESCQFAYINLGSYVDIDKKSGKPVIDVVGLEEASRILTRSLDNALEISIGNYASSQSAYVMKSKRKIGIGVCGVADMLSRLGIPYDSLEAREKALDTLALINYSSKLESVNLADERGSALAMDSNVMGNRHTTGEKPLIAELFGGISTEHVSSSKWNYLAEMIRSTKRLRNVTTVSLPPTGRSALVVDASTGIEPHFRTGSANIVVRNALEQHVANISGAQAAKEVASGGFRSEPWMDSKVQDLLASATDIRPLGHVSMAATCQLMSDEAVAKTINLPGDSTPGEVLAVYRMAREAGMSGITVYREGTFGQSQPKRLDKR